jgi:hypothetical protein
MYLFPMYKWRTLLVTCYRHGREKESSDVGFPQNNEKSLALASFDGSALFSIRTRRDVVFSMAAIKQSVTTESRTGGSWSHHNKWQEACGILSPLLVNIFRESNRYHAYFWFYLVRIHKSNAGGGGERVLWTAIASLQDTEPDIVSVVYSGDVDATKEDIIDKVKVCQRSMSCFAFRVDILTR